LKMLTSLILLFFFYIFEINSSTSAAWSIVVANPDGTRRVIHIPLVNGSPNDQTPADPSTCQNCFHFQTIDKGRRLLVTPCGDSTCVPMINSTYMQQVSPSIKYDFDKCGQTREMSTSVNPKSLKLKISTSVQNTLRTAEYPWLVRIESRSNLYSRTVTLCSGTLIHPQWIVTAAHCLIDSQRDRPYSTSGVNIFMGNYNRMTTSRTELVEKPAFYIIHPKFQISRLSPAPIHDLALIRLAKPVPLSSSINIACLPESGDQLRAGTLAFTAGWGHSSPSSTATNEPRKARIKIAPSSCRQLMIKPGLHICGRNERGNNICSGDSGSGLLVRAGVKSNNGTSTIWKWHIFGVASYGLDECSPDVNHDNAFASIANDVVWIREMMNKY